MDAVLGEVNVMGQFTLENLKKPWRVLKQEIKIPPFRISERKTINDMEKIMTAFSGQVDESVTYRGTASGDQEPFYTVSDLERVGDHAENIAELADNMRKDEVTFSQEGLQGYEADCRGNHTRPGKRP